MFAVNAKHAMIIVGVIVSALIVGAETETHAQG